MDEAFEAVGSGGQGIELQTLTRGEEPEVADRLRRRGSRRQRGVEGRHDARAEVDHLGVGTDVQTGPDGHLYVVSLTKGTVYEIAPRDD
jgi:hypothetical protein